MLSIPLKRHQDGVCKQDGGGEPGLLPARYSHVALVHGQGRPNPLVDVWRWRNGWTGSRLSTAVGLAPVANHL